MLNISGRHFLIAASACPFGTHLPDSIVSGLGIALRERGAVVEIMTVPFNAPNEDAVLRNATAWSLFDFGPPSNFDAMITTSFPSFHLNGTRKIVWLTDTYRYSLDLYGHDNPVFFRSAENETKRILLNRLMHAALDSARGLFFATASIQERIDKFLGLSGSLLPPLPPPSIKPNRLDIELDQKGTSHSGLSLFIVVDHTSLQLLYALLDKFTTSSLTIQYTLYSAAACKEALTSKMSAAHNNNRKNTYHTSYNPHQWNKSISQADLVLDLSNVQELNPVILEAARWNKPYYSPNNSGWNADLIQHALAGKILSEQPEEWLELLNHSPEHFSQVGQKWLHYYQQTWDDLLTQLLDPLFKENDI